MISAALARRPAHPVRVYSHVEVKMWPEFNGSYSVVVYGDGVDELHRFGAPNEAAAKQLYDEVLRRLRALGGVEQ